MPSKYVSKKERLMREGKFCPIYEFPYMEGEEWRPITDRSIPNVSEVYFISNMGRVFSIYRGRCKLIEPREGNCGYLNINFWTKDGKAAYRKVHRVEMIEFCYRPDFEGLEVNHIDGNKHNNCLWNLEWCTRLENMHHAIETGLLTHIFVTGENSRNAQITDAQSEQIGQLLAIQQYSFE